MCEPSKVADDWVTKGCHIHVDGVELNIFTNHLGTIDFRAVFSGTPEDRVKAAIRAAYERCLPDADMRRRWVQRLEMARIHMLGYDGDLASLANGRMFDFKMIRIAIQRWGEPHANL